MVYPPLETKHLQWNEAKNELLKKDRDISFEEALVEMKNGNLLAIIDHPHPDQYPNQQLFVICFDNYVYYMPFIESEHTIFLKTIIPSRKLTKHYLKNE